MTSRHAWVCQACHNIVRYPNDRYTFRVELVRVDSQHRDKTRTLAHLCLACGRDAIATLDPVPMETLSLLGDLSET